MADNDNDNEQQPPAGYALMLYSLPRNIPTQKTHYDTLDAACDAFFDLYDRWKDNDVDDLVTFTDHDNDHLRMYDDHFLTAEVLTEREVTDNLFTKQ